MNQRHLVQGLLLPLLLQAGVAQAVEIGDLHLLSRFGERLFAVISVKVASDERLEASCFKVARLGEAVDGLPWLDDVSITLYRGSGGSETRAGESRGHEPGALPASAGGRDFYSLRLSSRKPLMDPVARMGIQVDCGPVRVSRSYTVVPTLADDPATLGRMAEPTLPVTVKSAQAVAGSLASPAAPRGVDQHAPATAEPPANRSEKTAAPSSRQDRHERNERNDRLTLTAVPAASPALASVLSPVLRLSTSLNSTLPPATAEDREVLRLEYRMLQIASVTVFPGQGLALAPVAGAAPAPAPVPAGLPAAAPAALPVAAAEIKGADPERDYLIAGLGIVAGSLLALAGVGLATWLRRRRDLKSFSRTDAPALAPASAAEAGASKLAAADAEPLAAENAENAPNLPASAIDAVGAPAGDFAGTGRRTRRFGTQAAGQAGVSAAEKSLFHHSVAEESLLAMSTVAHSEHPGLDYEPVGFPDVAAKPHAPLSPLSPPGTSSDAASPLELADEEGPLSELEWTLADDEAESAPAAAPAFAGTEIDARAEVQPVIELAEVMLSFGRIKGAAMALQEYIESKPTGSLTPWLKLLNVYRAGGMKSEFEQISSQLNSHFNVEQQHWETPEMDPTGSMADTVMLPDSSADDEAAPAAVVPMLKATSLEDMPRLSQRLTELWGTPACLEFLNQLLRDNRGGQRSGFPLEVVEEILFLIELGLVRATEVAPEFTLPAR